MQGSCDVPGTNGAAFILPAVPPRFESVANQNAGRFYTDRRGCMMRVRDCPEPVRMSHELGPLVGYMSKKYDLNQGGRPSLRQWPTPGDSASVRLKYKDFWALDECGPAKPIRPVDNLKIGEGTFSTQTTYRSAFYGTCQR